MNMDSDTETILKVRYVRQNDIESEDTGQEVLIYLPCGDRTLYLNDSAAIVWRLCNGDLSGEDIAGMLAEAYPEAADTIHDEIAGTLREMVAQRLVEARG